MDGARARGLGGARGGRVGRVSRTRPGARRSAPPAPRKGTEPPRPGAPAAPRAGLGDGWLALVAAAAAILVYLPSLGNGLVRDDSALIGGIANWGAGLGTLLVRDFWAPAGAGSGLWRPLVTLSLWVDAHLGGDARLAFHLTNVLLHGAASAALFLVIAHAGMPRAAALAGALWFATMPAHAEAVAWVVGRTDVLSALLVLLAYGADRRARVAGRAWPGALALGAAALALLSKESALAIVPLIAAAEWVRTRTAATRLRSALVWIAPYAGLVALWLVAHERIAEPGGLPVYVDPAAPARWPAAAWTLLPHFARFLWPWAAHAPEAALVLPAGGGDPRVALGVVLTLAALAGWVVLAARRAAALVPATLALASLAPALVLAWAGRALTTGERLLYLASAGVAWLAALGLARALASPRARRPALGVALVLVVGSALVAVPLQRAWHDETALYARMRAAQPRDPVGWIGGADLLAQRGQRAAAEQALAVAARLGPRVPLLHLTRAALHYRYGEWAPVLASADSTLALVPRLRDARLLRATALLRLRRLAEARAEVAALRAEQPGEPQALALAGQLLLVSGSPREAAAALEVAAPRRPDDPAVWYALGMARGLGGDPAGARLAFARTVALDPGYYDGWLQLLRACLASGDRAGASAALARAAALPEASDGRAAALARELDAPR